MCFFFIIKNVYGFMFKKKKTFSVNIFLIIYYSYYEIKPRLLFDKDKYMYTRII